LIKQAFFFQGDALLLPADFPDLRISQGISFEFAGKFNEPEIFEIPAIDENGSVINAVSVLPGTALPENWKAIPVRHVLTTICAAEGVDAVISNKPVSGILRACHIAQWRRDSRFCGTCGAENRDAPALLHRLCPVCGRIEFPRICPAVITLITDSDNRILLAHNKKFRAGLYSLISGFNEAGESMEDTVAREIREEVNIEVKDIEYVKSQPWPFPNSLMLGFKARYASGTLKPDGEEIEDAQWFTKVNLPDIPGKGSLSRFLIDCWMNEKI